MTMQRILVIDDSELILALARLGLEGGGRFQVLTASSGLDGLALAAAEQPDAVLLDLVMPDFDGAATLAALRAAPRTRQIPVVLLTGQEQPPDLGADAWIPKPFDPATLADRV